MEKTWVKFQDLGLQNIKGEDFWVSVLPSGRKTFYPAKEAEKHKYIPEGRYRFDMNFMDKEERDELDRQFNVFEKTKYLIEEAGSEMSKDKAIIIGGDDYHRVMSSNIESAKDVNGDIVFSGRITAHDMFHAELGVIDQVVLPDPDKGMADVLQKLQILAFRIKQMWEEFK